MEGPPKTQVVGTYLGGFQMVDLKKCLFGHHNAWNRGRIREIWADSGGELSSHLLPPHSPFTLPLGLPA